MIEIQKRPEAFAQLLRHQQSQVLKLVTESFCQELASFGVDQNDLVQISVHVLDFVTGAGAPDAELRAARRNGSPVSRSDIEDAWRASARLVCRDTSIQRLAPDHVPTLARWLGDEKLQHLLLGDVPPEPEALRRYVFETPGNEFFGIFHSGELVGAIGGARLDGGAGKMEMKKFIGEERHRGRGIGKKATLLWLHYAFAIRGLNKVYLFSLGGNIRNINLNTRMGFELEGVLRQEVKLGHAYLDVVRMGLLKERWEEAAADRLGIENGSM